MKGLCCIKKFAMHYIVLLFVTALIGQPVLNGVVLANQTTVVTVNPIIEEENNEEVGDDDDCEASIDFYLPKYDNLTFGSSLIETSKICVAKELSLVLDMFIPPPEFI